MLTGLIQVLGTRAAAPDGVSLPAPAYLLLVAGPVALLLRRRRPALAYALSAAATVAYALSPYPRGPFFVAAAMALFAAFRAGRQEPAVAITAAGYLIYVFAGRLLPDLDLRRPSWTHAVVLAVSLFVLFVLAEGNRMRAEQFAQIARVRSEQAKARAEQERRQASEERLRIARELHDVLGHHLSLINVQAGVGLHLMDNQPEQARAALAAIKEASAEALREVRSVLGALHPAEEAAPRTPVPSLAEVAALVADVEAAGLSVTLDVRGEPRPLPAELDRAGYRIVQEALTNVRRHAGPGATASVRVGYGESQLTLCIDDDGIGAAGAPAGSAGGGTGIPGMRERATALGGTLTAGPIERGFRVEATLPIKEYE